MEKLKKELAALKERINSLEFEKNNLHGKLSASQSKVSELEGKLVKSETVQNQTGETLKALRNENFQLREDLNKATKPTESSLVIKKADGVKAPEVFAQFKLNNTTYGVVYKAFKFKGKNLTAENVAESKELQKQLLEIGSGAIQKVVGGMLVNLKGGQE